jgi:hypothetical protein
VPVTLEGTSTISGSVTITNTPSVNVIKWGHGPRCGQADESAGSSRILR